MPAQALQRRWNTVAWVLLTLLACNPVYYLVAGRISEALESAAWYVLLLLFLLETARDAQARSATTLALIHGVRMVATLAIAVSAVLYVMEKEWLDAANLFLWIAVVALLEVEVRRPVLLVAHRRAFTATATLLYGGLALLVFIWLARREWMDAWDAALWLTAFALLEFKLLHPKQKIV